MKPLSRRCRSVGKPTLVNNVETLANLPAIMEHGPKWYRRLGTERFPGTKLFTLSGNITNPGVYEFPVGVTIRQLFEEVGGGCPNGKRLYAIQTGGASGNIIPASLLDTPWIRKAAMGWGHLRRGRSHVYG